MAGITRIDADGPAVPVGGQTRTIAIVGGGVFGLGAAIELTRRGWFVRLFDLGEPPHPAASSTDISKAVRMDYGADAFYMELAERSIERWHSWNERLGETVYHEVGFLLVRRSAMEPGCFEAESYDLLRRRGHRPERVGSDDLRRRFPAWNAEAYVDGYYNPRAGWSPSGRVVALLARRARAAGVGIHAARVVRLRESASCVDGVVTSQGSAFSADRVLVAAGAWTPTLVPELSEQMWATGQPVLHFAPRNPEDFEAAHFPVWGADISRTGWYGFPITADGELKIANHGPGRRVDPGAPLSVSELDVERCREFCAGTFPTLAGAPLIGSRLCLYCDTKDGDFWIDHHPERQGLVVAAGGSGHGFKFAPLLGEIIADVVERRPNRWAERFAWREPEQGRSEQARHTG